MSRANTSWLSKQISGYNLGEMAVFFGVGSVLVGVLLSLFWVLCSDFHVFPSDTLGEICIGLWIAFTMWLWTVLILVGKAERETRTSDRDLRAISVLFFIDIGVHTFITPHPAGIDWHLITLIFEWIVIALHVIYFLLALCIWVRVPRAILARFVLSLLIVLWQTFYGHGV